MKILPSDVCYEIGIMFFVISLSGLYNAYVFLNDWFRLVSASMESESQRLVILKLLEANPNLSQRGLAEAMGVSLGKVNYCLKALIQRGFVKLANFRRSDNKRAYAYLLTPAGLEEKTRIVLAFLRLKEAEFETIHREIQELRSELRCSPPQGMSSNKLL